MRSRRAPILVAWMAIVAACGSRTELLVPTEPPPRDAGLDVVRHPDAFVEQDAPEEDALPPIDVSVPVDVASDCPDAGSTLVYVISSDNNLLSFYPPTATFTLIGTIACPVISAGDEPFSMAVDRTGTAYIVFSNDDNELLGGELFRVSTANAKCEATSYQVNSNPEFHTFGMGFSQDAVGTGETLYVAGDPVGQGSTPSELGTIDTTTFDLTSIGAFNPTISQAELTGTGAGDLFAFYSINGGTDSAIGQIDKTTAAVVGQSDLSGVAQGFGWAFAFWGGDFYTFTSPNASGSVVTRYRPSDGSIVQVAQSADLIVGAGVSTCAPQQ